MSVKNEIFRDRYGPKGEFVKKPLQAGNKRGQAAISPEGAAECLSIFVLNPTI